MYTRKREGGGEKLIASPRAVREGEKVFHYYYYYYYKYCIILLRRK